MDRQYPAGTAFHEAGHAVVGHSLGLRVGGIHIDEEGEGGGARICECTGYRTFVEQTALKLAGMKAEALWEQSTLPLGRSDDEEFVKQCSGLSDKCREEIRRLGRKLAGEKLAKYAAKVKAVAEHLIKYGQMTEFEFEALMRAH